jgi:hypothetical protein
MKIEELKKAIRGLIRAEVKKAVSEEVSRAMGKVLVEMVKEIKSNNPTPTIVSERKDAVGQDIEYEPETSEMPILKTNNPKLNTVLAETARHFTPLPKTAEMSTGLMAMMEGDFEKIGKSDTAVESAPVTKLDFLKQMVGPSGPAVMNQPSALDGGSEVPDILKKVFKKDFRAVMKRMDEQKKGLAPGGYIDPTKVLSG